MSAWEEYKQEARKYLFRYLLNKNFFIFLFFLALAYIFWLLMTLNESYDSDVDVQVTIVNVPDNVVLLSSETETISVSINDKGFTLMGYKYGDVLKPIKLDFKTYRKDLNNVVISAEEIQQLVYQQLSASSKIVSIKPEKVTFYYNYGLSKRVPVRYRGRIDPEGLYFVSKVIYSPDSVDVYSTEEKLDSISVVYTEVMAYSDFHDTLTVKSPLMKNVGMKCVPDEVTISFITDILMEASVTDIPITGIHVPDGKIIRTFPSKATVKFVAGMTVVKELSADDFTVVVDYRDVANGDNTDKCTLYLTAWPENLSKVSLSFSQVDYIIEDVNYEEEGQDE